jgi:hypothetical protein
MNPDHFPVIYERSLPRPERRWLVSPWRDPAQIPVLAPGCVYVFAVDGEYKERPGLVHPRGTDPEFVRATSVSMVNLRHRLIAATAWVPSKDPATDFIVQIMFRCQVAQAAVVAHYGLTDVRANLSMRVRLDTGLAPLRHEFGVNDIAALRQQVMEALDPAYRGAPPSVPGMWVTYEGLHVHTPSDLRKHWADMRELSWSIEEEKRRVEHTENLLRTPQRAEAAAIVRKETTTQQAAQRRFDERDRQTERLIEQVKAWIEGDGGKRAPIDRRWLAEELFRRLTDLPAPTDGEVTFEYAQHTNGQADAAHDGPRIPPGDRLDGV